MLQSFDRGNVSVDQFTGNFRVELDQRAGGPVNVVQVVVGPTGSVGAPEQAVVDYIRSTFADRAKPDLIVTVAGPAAVFARKYRQQLFPDTPTLFASVDQKYLGDARAWGQRGRSRGRQRLSARHRGHPAAAAPDQAGVHGDGVRTNRPVLASRARERVQAISRPADICLVRRSVPSGDPAPLCDPARQLGDLLCQLSARTRQGQRLRTSECSPSCTPRPMRHCLRRTACTWAPESSADRCCPSRTSVGDTADVAVRLLSGTPPGRIRVPPRLAGQPTFDWRELQRWGIPESRLPPGSVVRYRAPSLWQRILGHGAERRRRAGRPIASDRRAPVPAPRTAAGRERQPTEPGARRRRQPPPDDVGADAARSPMSSVNPSAR